MVNITYDASGDLIWTNPADGTKVVYNFGDTSFVLISMALVFVMSPGVGFFYSGLQRRKNALSAIFITMSTVAVVTLQWFVWGFSLTFSDKGSAFIGNLYYFAMRNVLDQPPQESTRIPMVLYCIYEVMFAAMTAAIAIGAIAERGRPGPSLVFIFIWTTIVYDPIACWTWNTLGWSKRIGVLDFAGGIPVHITSGASALAISFHLGKRHGFETDAPYRANNATFVALGTVMMWFGWFGFNGGSALSANLVAIQACINTNIAAAAGGLTGMILDYRIERKWSSISFCSGVVAGLITITPGSGFVGAPAALLFGILGGGVCNFVSKIMIFGCDDALAIFATHGVGGFLGSILTGIFAQKNINALNGIAKSAIHGGWLDQNWKQVGFQAAGSAAATVYAFVVTLIILKLMALAPVLELKSTKDTERLGIDLNELGEQAFDYTDFPHSQNVAQVVTQAINQALTQLHRTSSTPMLH